MNRRKRFKTGLVLAGGSVLASATGAKTQLSKQTNSSFLIWKLH